MTLDTLLDDLVQVVLYEAHYDGRGKTSDDVAEKRQAIKDFAATRWREIKPGCEMPPGPRCLVSNERLYFSVPLTDEQRAEVEKYFDAKYGLGLEVTRSPSAPAAESEGFRAGEVI